MMDIIFKTYTWKQWSNMWNCHATHEFMKTTYIKALATHIMSRKKNIQELIRTIQTPSMTLLANTGYNQRWWHSAKTLRECHLLGRIRSFHNKQKIYANCEIYFRYCQFILRCILSVFYTFSSLSKDVTAVSSCQVSKYSLAKNINCKK